MNKSFVSEITLPELSLQEKFKNQGNHASFNLEITARCNNNCRHCYINLPAQDEEAKVKELSLTEIKKIVDEAVSLGALWCLIAGGEPILREDFFEIYLYLKKKGLLVSVYTNATLITAQHIDLFKKYPPRDIEITVYGVTKETYERVARRPGSFAAFIRGLNLLLENNIKVRLKAMALRSNVQELSNIAQFCRQRTKDYFRFDPFLYLRFDGDHEKNQVIKSERLSPEEIVTIEKADSARFNVLKKRCDKLTNSEFSYFDGNRLFYCGAGNGHYAVSYDGFFHLCPALYHPDCIYDLKKGSLTEACQSFAPRVRDMRSYRKEFLKKCRACEVISLCTWCLAHAYLEIGELDKPLDYFCEIAHARAEAFKRESKTAKKI